MSYPNFLLLASAWCAVGYMLLFRGDSTGAVLASMVSISAVCLAPGRPA